MASSIITNRRFSQFSLRSVFVVTTVIAVICAIAAYFGKSRMDGVARDNLVNALIVSEILEDKQFGVTFRRTGGGHSGGWASVCSESYENIDILSNSFTIDEISELLKRKLHARLVSYNVNVSGINREQQHGASIIFYYNNSKGVIVFRFVPVESTDGVSARLYVRTVIFQ